MPNKKRFYSISIILLVYAVFFQVLQSCSQPNGNNAENTGETKNNGLDSQKINSEAADTEDVPELNFNGETVSILYRDYMEYEVEAEAEIGEPVNDAVYRRNIAVEERLNVKFNMIPVSGTWDYREEFLSRIKNSVSSGDNAYEIVQGYAAYIVGLHSGGYLTNWKNIPYVDFEKPWWNKDFVDEMTLNDRLYFTTGDLALSLIWEANTLFFNKKMWQNYGFEKTPYEMVKTGKWTLDNMYSITKQVSQDLNSDGKYTENDLYGYVTDTHNQIDAYIEAFDVPVTKRNEAGIPYFVIEEDKFSSAFFKLFEFVRQNVSTYAGIEQPITTDIYSLYRPIFEDERALILAEYLGNSSQMRDYDFDFGILPFPKLDESQGNYYTKSQDGYTMFCVPATVINLEKIGAVMEALSAETYKSVLPAFYEVALKTKYARDDDSSEMIDIIRKGITFNFGVLYVVPLENPHLQWRFLITNNKNNIVSEVEKQMKKFQANLQKVVDSYYE